MDLKQLKSGPPRRWFNMQKKKAFDCVEMKWAIQAKHAREFEGLPDQEIADRIMRELKTSNDPVAVWYRKCLAQESLAAQ